MKKTNRLYTRIFIKSSVFYYTFLLLGTIFFLYTASQIRLDVRQEYSAQAEKDRIVIFNYVEPINEKIYLYQERNQKIYKYKIKSIENFEDKTIFILEQNSQITGELMAEVTIGSQSLLERIFVKAGKN